MSEALRFELLGPQRAWHADRPLDLGPAKQRAVLAVLLLAAGRPVRTGQIVEAVWPEEAPVNGANVVQKHVAGLRRVLEPDRSPRTPARVLTLTDAGYVLRVAPEAVDAARFERGVQRARQAQADGRTAEALAEVDAALELWQGEPFTGFAGPWFDAARHRLVELRAVALETRTELELAAGRHDEAVGRLVELTAEFPVRERLRLQLMLALHRGGRQAEALAAYRDFAVLLRDEYGIEPGEPLQALHRRILRSDPTLLPPVADLPAPPGGVDLAPGLPPPPVAGPRPTPAHPVPPQTVAPDAVPAGPAAAARPTAPRMAALPSWPTPAPAAAPAPTAVVPVGPVPWPLPPAVSHPKGFRGQPRSRAMPAWLSLVSTLFGMFIAFVSFGFLTWLVMLAHAIWWRSFRLLLTGLGYLAVVGALIYLIETSPEVDNDEAGTATFVGFGLIVVGAVVGALHILLLNPHVRRALSRVLRPGEVDRLAARSRREEARQLLLHHPGARWELRIGRPDLSRAYDDGGLIDVNAVPDQVLLGLTVLNPGQARHLVLDRVVRGPYTSMEELVARCMLPPAVNDRLRDLLLFLPPEPPAAPPPLVDMPDESGSDGRAGTGRGGAAAARG
ncbi:BTAD domain-containing putative transcriptional regulator [Micromonospora sp. NPDC049282]|uniref:AfsR/SARP family transcriptional regulator n=1 Tax=Micromonospora sp. NPDC049282 TaxID=3364269 RepID=UPI00371231C6